MATSAVSVASQHIESKMKEGANELVKVKSETNSLLSQLKIVNNLLVSAEEKAEVNTSQEFRSWVKELRKIAYEAEDEVDTLVTKSSLLSLFYPSTRAHRASKNLRVLERRVSNVKTKMDEHAQGSNWSKNEVMSRARGSQAPKGHLPGADEFVYGIEDEIKRVIGQLTGQPRVDRLAIIGMGGSGKTTMARSIYNHKAVVKHFHFHVWVSVSRGLNTSTVLLEILKQIRGQKTRFPWFNNEDELEHDEPSELVSQLADLLNGKTCLLVLDDVWDLESLNNFITLVQPDNYDSQIYTIVITSRQTPCNIWSIHQPERLTDEDCWKLFSKVASNSSKALTIEYRPMAMEMLKKCQGLPLAIVALGRLLKTKDTARMAKGVISDGRS